MGHDLGRKFVEKRQIQIHFESLSEDVFGWTAHLTQKSLLCWIFDFDVRTATNGAASMAVRLTG